MLSIRARTNRRNHPLLLLHEPERRQHRVQVFLALLVFIQNKQLVINHHANSPKAYQTRRTISHGSLTHWLIPSDDLSDNLNRVLADNL